MIVNPHPTTAATLQLIFSVLSFVSCAIVVASIWFYFLQKKTSVHLQLVYRLLISDLLMSICIIFYYFIQYVVDTDQLNDVCKFYLPAVVTCFIASYVWTVMLALRFSKMKSQNQGRKTWKPSFNIDHLWILPFFCTVPMLIVAWANGEVTTVHSNNEDTNQSCTFDHDKYAGIILDLLLFQLPLLITIAVNIYFYSQGLLAMGNAPHSAIARQMRRAGGYLGVLLGVWLPNMVYNFLTIFYGKDSSYGGFLDFVVFLSSFQGFLNVCVYVWSNGEMRRWLYRNIIFFRFFDDPSKIDQMTNNDSMTNTNSTTTKHNSGNFNYDSDEESQQNSNSLHDSLTLNPHLTNESLNTDSFSNSNNNSFITENPLAQKSLNIDGRVIRSNTSSTRSILIPNNNQRVSIQQRPLASSVDLDTEKFVRFGENTTRFLSTSTRPSDVMSRPSLEDGEEDL